MDETPLFVNVLYKKTIATIGSKEVIIKIHGQESSPYCNIVNYCRRYKVTLLLVFKDKSRGRAGKRILD